ncbi:hypothetical protein JB92DRAFT_3098157 [Gautieria morchelliformis]|nr:hypothetical protein JB92DRAFT_3098157 [Gautieria morchelliformis]
MEVVRLSCGTEVSRHRIPMHVYTNHWVSDSEGSDFEEESVRAITKSEASRRSSRIAKHSRSASEAEDSFYTVVTPDSVANNAKKTRIDKSPVAESDGEVFAISSDSDLESTLPWKEYGGSPLSGSLFLPDLDDSDVISTSKSGSSTKPITRSVGTPNSPAVPAEVVDDDPNCGFSSPNHTQSQKLRGKNEPASLRTL